VVLKGHEVHEANFTLHYFVQLNMVYHAVIQLFHHYFCFGRLFMRMIHQLPSCGIMRPRSEMIP